METLYAITVLLVLATISGAQLQSSVERPCPGEQVTFTCTISSLSHRWESSALALPRSVSPGDQGGVISDPPFQFNVTEVIPNSAITSTATVNATANLNSTLVVCEDSIGMLPDQSSTINIIGSPSVPSLSCVDVSGNEHFNEDFSGTVNVTVNWTLSGGDSADFYLINITTNGPPYGRLLNITTDSVTQYELTGFMTGYEYNITVRGVNCGSQEGGESEPLTIRPQVPAAPNSSTITLSYNQSSRRLLFIDTTWNPVLDPVDPCPGVSGSITQYQIRLQTRSSVTTENVNVAECTAGRCSYTFEPPSNPPSSYDSVSVAAENVVGVGAASNLTTQRISTTNNLLAGEVEDLSSPSNARLNCIFLSGFTGSAHCTVQYGTDPTYMNLPYSAESNETDIAGDSVSVVLRERLNSSTVYYYTVSAVSGNITVTVQGTFTTPQYSCSVTELYDLPATDATFLPDVSLLNASAAQYPSCDDGSVGSAVLVNTTLNTATVAYYTGTTPGSTACFVCDESSGYELNITIFERVCQNDATWSGSADTCVCNQLCLLGWHIALIVIGAIALVVAIVMIIVNGSVVSCMGGCCGSECCAEEGENCCGSKKCCAEKCCVGSSCCTEKGEDCCGSKCCADKDCCQIVCIVLLVVAIVFCVTGVALWIAVGVVVPECENGNANACDLDWLSTRDGLIISAFVFSILALIFVVVWVLVHWLTSGRGGDETDGRPGPEGSEDKIEMKDDKLKKEEEEPQYDVTTQRFPTSPVPLLSETDPKYGKLGEHSETGGGDIYNKTVHGGHPHAVPNPVDPNYSHVNKGASRPQGASRPPAETLEYDVVGTEPRYKPKPKEQEETKGKKKGRK